MKKNGILTLEEYRKHLENCLSCYCGLCNKNCPSYLELKKEAISPRGLSQIALGIVEGRNDLAELSDEILYACTGCRACETYCSENVFIENKERDKIISLATVTEILRSMKVETGKIDPKLRDVLNNIIKYGNPYGINPATRENWINDLSIDNTASETLLYLSPTVPYEENSKLIAESIINIFKKANYKFQVLRNEEIDSGATARALGDEGLFEEMIDYNTQIIKKHGFKRIICISPHDYDAFMNYYQEFENIEIQHYTQALLELLKNKQITLQKALNKKITYHDPCYLGRKNNIIEEPREILESIPGIEFHELEFSKSNTYCCGGGGTGLWLELPKLHIDLNRAAQIRELMVNCVIVACPICAIMLDSAMSSRDYNIEVKDIAQLLMNLIYKKFKR